VAKTPDPRRLENLLRCLNPTSAPIKSFRVDSDGSVSVELYPLPHPATDAPVKRIAAPELLPEAADMDGPGPGEYVPSDAETD
jgi:hypothetical protein